MLYTQCTYWSIQWIRFIPLSFNLDVSNIFEKVESMALCVSLLKWSLVHLFCTKTVKQKHVKINIFKKSDLNISDPQFSKYQSIVYIIHKILFLFHEINMYVKCIERIDTNRSREKVPTHSWIIVIGLFRSWWTIMTRGRSGRFQHLSCLQKSTDKSFIYFTFTHLSMDIYPTN